MLLRPSMPRSFPEAGAAQTPRLARQRLEIGEIQDVRRANVWDDSGVTTSLLIVDDHPGFRRFARKLLEAAGYDVVGDAADGAAALAAAERLDPDVVLLDVLLPDMTGFDVTRVLSAQGRDRPVVVLTSSRTESDFGERVTMSPARGFISKSELTATALAAVLGEAA